MPRSGCAWTAGNANSVAIQTELCTPSGASANWSRATWNSHPVMLRNVASWVAEECAFYGIPIVKLTPQQAQGGGRGVCQHADLGSWGGGHFDCGSNFPIDDVIAMAAGGSPTPTPTPPEPTPEVPDVIPAPCVFNMDDGSQQNFYIDASGRLMHYYWVPGKPWVGEGLSTGWDPTSELCASQSSQGTWQVWGVLAAAPGASAKRAQCYWSGKAWVTQPL